LNRHQWDDASGRNAGDETWNKSARNFKAAKKNMPARTGDADAEPGTTVLGYPIPLWVKRWASAVAGVTGGPPPPTTILLCPPQATMTPMMVVQLLK
jgi:hypothetical protein